MMCVVSYKISGNILTASPDLVAVCPAAAVVCGGKFATCATFYSLTKKCLRGNSLLEFGAAAAVVFWVVRTSVRPQRLQNCCRNFMFFSSAALLHLNVFVLHVFRNYYDWQEMAPWEVHCASPDSKI